MHSLDTRYKALVHYKQFLPSLRKVSRIYNVSKSSLQRWLSKSGVRVRKRRTRKQLCKDIYTTITNALTNNPFLTSKELVHLLSKELNLTVSQSTSKRYIHQAGFSSKKAFRVSSKVHPPGQVLSFCNDYLKATNLVCIDEAGFYLGDHKHRGYAPIGKRLNVSNSTQLRRSRISLAMAISKDGVVGYKITKESFNKRSFIDFIASLQLPPGTTLLLDNVPFHKSKETLATFQAKGYLPLFILPYSPKLNAIENVFSVLKSRYRALCPVPTVTGFNYSTLLERVICQLGTFERFFYRVNNFVQQAIASHGVGFSGYG